MMSKTKILGIALAAVAITALLVYVPLTLAGSNNRRRNQESNPDILTITDTEQLVIQPIDGLRLRLLRRFIANATPVEVQGTVVALVRQMLVLNIRGGQVRIHLPPTWIVGEAVLETEDLFETDFLTVGQSITVKTLKGTLITGEGYSIYVLFGYEIINASSIHAYAVLPFNIETS